MQATIGWEQLRRGTVASPLADAASRAIEETAKSAAGCALDPGEFVPQAEDWFKAFAE